MHTNIEVSHNVLYDMFIFIFVLWTKPTTEQKLMDNIDKRQRVLQTNMEKIMMQQNDMMEKLSDVGRACGQIYKMIKQHTEEQGNVNEYKVCKNFLLFFNVSTPLHRKR